MPKLPKAKLTKYRKTLHEVLRELGSKIERMEDSVLRSDSDTSPDEADEFGSENYSTEFQLGLIENEEELLREARQALDRIEAGSYGICESCETPIPERRLEVLPWARFCVNCQRRIEQGEDVDAA